MQGLIDSVPFKAVPYLEYGWVCAPNTAGQGITANTVTTLTLDTEVQDDYGYGSIASNQVTLAAGTYYYEANTLSIPDGSTGMKGTILALYNVTDSSYVRRKRLNGVTNYLSQNGDLYIKGQFTISSSKAFDLRIAVDVASTIGNGSNGTAGSIGFSLSTANADQRTSLQLWKVA